MIYPHAFVSEHVETLVEIEEEYREMAHHMGVPGFARVPTVSAAPDFINGLKATVENACAHSHLCVVGAGKAGDSLCPKDYKACARRTYGKAA